jgi:prophage tail gpP-like protein
MRIRLGKQDLKLVSATINKPMDSGVHEWSAVVEWIPGRDPDFDKLAAPRSFAESEAWIGDKKLITGHKWINWPRLQQNNHIRLSGFSKTYALTISNPKEQREFQNSGLDDISREYTQLFSMFTAVQGITEAEYNQPFERVTIAARSKIFDFLQDLARQRGFLTSSTEDGDLFYLRANTNQQPVGSLIEGHEGNNVPFSENFAAVFDDSEVFQTYQAIVDNPTAFGKSQPIGIAKDLRVKIPTIKTVTLNSLIDGAGQKELEFTRNQTIAKSLSIPFEVSGWRDKNNKLWRENTLVSVQSPTLFVPDGFTFLIRAVQYSLDNRGETTVLSLVPPQLYTGESIDEPWG